MAGIVVDLMILESPSWNDEVALIVVSGDADGVRESTEGREVDSGLKMGREVDGGVEEEGESVFVLDRSQSPVHRDVVSHAEGSVDRRDVASRRPHG